MENISQPSPQFIKDSEWVGFPGGELEGKRPKALCPSCREHVGRAFQGAGRAFETRRNGNAARTLCFQCYRAEIDREHALKAAGELDTASVERFQSLLPFEPVNRPRLEMLKVERIAARTVIHKGVARFEDRRRQAQLAARHALQRIAAGLPGNNAHKATLSDRAREIAYAIHAAELQLPESWLPFVVSR